MFHPPRCPNPKCKHHRTPRAAFYRRKGHYHPKCRARPVPRFVCRSCRLGFSRQTFRTDYRDHRPHLNPQLFRLLASGLGLRQSSRVLGLSRRCTELKFRKIARHLRGLNVRLRGKLPPGAVLQFDEFESYEGRRNTRPLTLPTLIERHSRFVIWAESAPIRPRGRMNAARVAAIAEDEARYGRRVDRSRSSIRRTLSLGAKLCPRSRRIVVETDEKPAYRALVRQTFGKHGAVHLRFSSRLPRTTWNPLFAINHTEAMARDLVGRLRRDSWLVSKRREFLDLQLQIFLGYRNYVRRRFNRDSRSPAQFLGFVGRRLRPNELFSWRQDWGELSPHPLSRAGESRSPSSRAIA